MYQMRRSESGEIGYRWFEDCRYVLKAFAQYVGAKREATALLPNDFEKFRHRLLQHGTTKQGNGLGVHAWPVLSAP